MSSAKKSNRLMLITSIISVIIYLLLACYLCYMWQDLAVSLVEQDPIWQSDPIWQLIFPFGLIPFIALIFWLLDWWKKYRWYILILVAIVSPLIGIISTVWWMFNLDRYFFADLLYFIVPALVAALIWIWFSKIIKIIVNSIRTRIFRW